MNGWQSLTGETASIMIQNFGLLLQPIACKVVSLKRQRS
jgi:hypothetical protein